MKKGLLLGSGLTVILLLSSIGFAATSNDVTVSIQPYARISVSGAAVFSFADADFSANGTATKTNTAVTLGVKTNSSKGCVVSASASDFVSVSVPAEKISVTQLAMQVGSKPQVSLATTSKPVATYTSKTNTWNTPETVTFTMTLNGDETALTDYRTVVNYTYAVTP